MSNNAFDTATYYDCLDGEELTHKTRRDAIEALLDEAHGGHAACAEAIVRLAPVTVRAYSRMVVSDNGRVAMVLGSIDAISLHLQEYDDPNGCGDSPWIDRASVIGILRKAIDEILDKHAMIWACEEVASREYSAEEIKELLR